MRNVILKKETFDLSPPRRRTPHAAKRHAGGRTERQLRSQLVNGLFGAWLLFSVHFPRDCGTLFALVLSVQHGKALFQLRRRDVASLPPAFSLSRAVVCCVVVLQGMWPLASAYLWMSKVTFIRTSAQFPPGPC